LFDTEAFTTLEDISIFNWDQTAIKYAPEPDSIMDKRHEKNTGLNDKQQMTAVFAAVTGEFLPPQLNEENMFICQLS